jgi:CBS domain-containing protein
VNRRGRIVPSPSEGEGEGEGESGLPVIDGEPLVGIVTETDLLNYFIRTLEAQP